MLFANLKEARFSDVIVKLEPLRKQLTVSFAKEPEKKLQEAILNLESCLVSKNPPREFKITSDFYELEDLGEILVEGFLNEGLVTRRIKFCKTSSDYWEENIVYSFKD